MTSAPRTGGRRSDATRNVETILDAAVGVLSARPDASMAQIAKASGLSRQTVYSHFPSRESLLTAVADRARDRALEAIDDVLSIGEDPREQLDRLVPAWWSTVGHHAHVLGVLGDEVALADGKAVRDFHDPILKRLEDLAKRGQDSGEFDDRVSAGWLASAFLGLVNTAADEVAGGRMNSNTALDALEASIPRVFGASAG